MSHWTLEWKGFKYVSIQFCCGLFAQLITWISTIKLDIIQFAYKIDNNCILPFFDTLVSHTDEGFSISVYRKHFAVSLPQYTHSCHPPSQKMAVFYTFVNSALNICPDPISFNSEIQYLKAIALDRGYNPSIVDKALFKLQNPRTSLSSHSNPNINITLPQGF